MRGIRANDFPREESSTGWSEAMGPRDQYCDVIGGIVVMHSHEQPRQSRIPESYTGVTTQRQNLEVENLERIARSFFETLLGLGLGRKLGSSDTSFR